MPFPPDGIAFYSKNSAVSHSLSKSSEIPIDNDAIHTTAPDLGFQANGTGPHRQLSSIDPALDRWDRVMSTSRVNATPVRKPISTPMRSNDDRCVSKKSFKARYLTSEDV